MSDNEAYKVKPTETAADQQLKELADFLSGRKGFPAAVLRPEPKPPDELDKLKQRIAGLELAMLEVRPAVSALRKLDDTDKRLDRLVSVVDKLADGVRQLHDQQECDTPKIQELADDLVCLKAEVAQLRADLSKPPGITSQDPPAWRFLFHNLDFVFYTTVVLLVLGVLPVSIAWYHHDWFIWDRENRERIERLDRRESDSRPALRPGTDGVARRPGQ